MRSATLSTEDRTGALLPGPSILIVDDSPMAAEMLETILRAEGFRTLRAGDGETARALSRTEAPDLILLDVVMPGESGFETCAALKSDPRTADIPIIFLSARDDVESKVQGLKAGGVDYVSKPLHGEEVLARVRVHLRMRENDRAVIREQRSRLEELRNAQQAILVRPEDLPEARFAVYYRPLQEAGGDFYDVFPLGPEGFGYFVSDVSGHGTSAAFLTSAVKALLRQYATPLFSPEDAMRGVDAVVRQIFGEEKYLTACYARLNRKTRRLTVVSAGHPPVLVIHSTGSATVVEMDTTPLGIFSALTLQKKEIRMAAGDRCFLFTDGLIEAAPGGGRRQGLEELTEACRLYRFQPIEKCVQSVTAAVRQQEAQVQDDLLLLSFDV